MRGECGRNQKEHEHIEHGCRQENADRQNRGGGEEQVERDAREEEDERKHQGDTESAGADMAHKQTVWLDLTRSPSWYVSGRPAPYR